MHTRSGEQVVLYIQANLKFKFKSPENEFLGMVARTCKFISFVQSACIRSTNNKVFLCYTQIARVRIANVVFDSLRDHICLLNSVELCLVLSLNDAVCFQYLDLNLFHVKPTYVSLLLSLSTVA